MSPMHRSFNLLVSLALRAQGILYNQTLGSGREDNHIIVH